MAPVPGDSSKTPAWHIDAARGPCTPSLDHLVGAGEQRGRNLKANRASGWKVDRELEFARLDYRQGGWLGTLEDFAAVDAVKGLGAQGPSGPGNRQLWRCTYREPRANSIVG